MGEKSKKTITLPHGGYQPNKAEQEEEIDMPGLSDKYLRDTIFSVTPAREPTD